VFYTRKSGSAMGRFVLVSFRSAMMHANHEKR
jgi:hypothetical protein